MASLTSSSRARRALLFMQHCRLTVRPQHPVNIRNASQFQSQFQSPSSSSPYDPSNFSKPLHRPQEVGPAPKYHYPRGRPVTQVRIPGLRPSLWTTIKQAFGWKPPITDYVPAPFTGANNPYKARKKWPPDFTKLHPMQQFHFEKTYRRRAKLAYTKPQWNRRIKLLQHTLVLTALIYFVFFAEPKDMGTPFDGTPDSTIEELERLEQEARDVKDARKERRWWNFASKSEPAIEKESNSS